MSDGVTDYWGATTSNEPPKELVEKTESRENEVQYKHNWLHSVVPTGDKFAAIYLAGYCPRCDSYYTKQLARDTQDFGAYVGRAGVPKFGCVGPDAQISGL